MAEPCLSSLARASRSGRTLVTQWPPFGSLAGDCWIGIVPFRMRAVRPAGLPALPYISYFLETNLRTYVHDGERPGVWFFSLEASRLIPVVIARLKWNLKYFWAQMQFKQQADHLAYQSRRWFGQPQAATEITLELDAKSEIFHATPGTLEHFLAERYILFTSHPRQGLLWGQVHHAPYPLKRAHTIRYQESLSHAAQIPGLHDQNAGGPEHVLYSPGVDVEIFPLQAMR